MSIGGIRSRARMLLIVLFLTIGGPFGVSVGTSIHAGASVPPQDLASQLAVSGSNGGGAGVTWSWALHYKNLSSASRQLHGYPTVVGMNVATSWIQLAVHKPNGYMGGWLKFTSNGKLKPLPEVLLRAHGGVASSMIEVSSALTAKSCPEISTPWVGILSGGRPFALKSNFLDRKDFETNSFVPGAKGRAG
jgi:hypothetical protein